MGCVDDVSKMMDTKPMTLFFNKLFSVWRDEEDALQYIKKTYANGEIPNPAIVASISNATKILKGIKDIYSQQQLDALINVVMEEVIQIPSEFQDLSQLPKTVMK